MTEIKGGRLSQVAKEVGVGVDHIVEFLKGKSFEVENKPTTKISSEAYEAVLKKFAPDMLAQKQAQNLSELTPLIHSESKHSHAKDEPVEQPVAKASAPAEKVEEPANEIEVAKVEAKEAAPVQEEPQKEAAEKPKPAKVEKPKIEAKLEVVEEAPKLAKEPEAKPEPVAEAPAPTQPVVAESQVAEVSEQTADAGKAMGLKVMGKIDLSDMGRGKKKAAPSKEVTSEKPKKSTAKAPEQDLFSAPAVEEVKESPREEAPKVVEVAEVAAPVAEQAPAPGVEVPAEPIAAAAPEIAPTTESEQAPEAKASNTGEPEVRQAPTSEREILGGLKILGKIELPTKQKKTDKAAPAGESAEAKKKRKRKRIEAEVSSSSDGVIKRGPTPMPYSDGRPANPGEARPAGTQGTDNRGPNTDNRRPAPNTGPGGGGGQQGGGARGGTGTGPRTGGQGAGGGNAGGGYQRPGGGYQGRPGGGGGGGRPTQATRMNKKRRKDERRARLIADNEEGDDNRLLNIVEFSTVNDLSQMMNVPVTEVIKVCMSMGLMVNINQRLDAETIQFVALEFGFEVQFKDATLEEPELEEADNEERVLERAPIVTIMGHVDHGKTSLLDFIRSSNVVAGEAGGITQHIGAYEVTLPNGRQMTFLDTPGHEAFTAMRARGAKVTDVAIIVIAVDDTVMPQTREAISHAQAAGVPIVFAFNKIDKEGARPERIREQLAEMNILVEEWGGKFQTAEVSAKTGLNVDQLLEKVLLETDVLELKADPNKRAVGTVIEASLDKGKGIVATVLVEKGTLHVGDPLLAGAHFGKVKAMYNERGGKVTSAGPATPVQVLGFETAPTSGDRMFVTDGESVAKEISTKRKQLIREQGIRTKRHLTLDEIGRRLAIGNFKQLNLIIKGDVDGSVEALSDSLQKLGTDEIAVNVVLKGVGQISDTDILLASASDAIIIGFQVRPSLSARKLAETEQIDIRTYSVIYDAIEEVKAAMEGMLSPTQEEKITCNVEVRDVFKITKVGSVAGCYVLDGKINRSTKIRLVRDGVVFYTGEIETLKRFKDDVKEVSAGYECGIMIKNYNDLKIGDIIEGFEEIEIARKL